MPQQFKEKLDKYKLITERAVSFIHDNVKSAGANGVIFGLSGGIDSAVIAYLCKKAIGNHCLALVMPNLDFTPLSETDDGILVATKLGLQYKIRPINFVANLFTTGDDDGEYTDFRHRRLTIGNLNARIRASYLYFEGQKRNYLVVGTDDKSEYLLGYFTKYGDGASDMLPIAELYKTEVRELGSYLGVPEHIISKTSSPHLWKEHNATRELGLGYEVIDKILKLLFEDNMSISHTSKKLLIPQSTVKRIHSFHVKSEHKRNLPPIANLRF